VEAIFISLNPKKNPQFEVELDSVKIKAKWEGNWKENLTKGTKIKATVKSFNPSTTPPLVLGPVQDE